jgi:hypothetical protein
MSTRCIEIVITIPCRRSIVRQENRDILIPSPCKWSIPPMGMGTGHKYPLSMATRRLLFMQNIMGMADPFLSSTDLLLMRNMVMVMAMVIMM